MRGVAIGAFVALAFALLATPVAIRFLRARGIGQPIQDEVTHHAAKSGTPTMGGIIISVAVLVGYIGGRLALGNAPSTDGLRVLAVVVAGAAIGFLDDWLKVRREKNAGGLRPLQKSVLQAAMIGGFCLSYLLEAGRCTTITFAGCDRVGFDVPPLVWAAFAFAFFWGTCNSVNFGDGIEGLLAGQGAVTFAAIAVIAFWQFRHQDVYDLPSALDLTLVAACLAAACGGFLWWNVTPMTVFMGDVGSLAIGAAIAGLALTMGIPLLVAMLGAVYAAQGVSVGLQIYTWKWYFKPRGGQRRLFRMAPIHHHFELVGWADGTILVRFWILNGLAAGLALMAFYTDALSAI